MNQGDFINFGIVSNPNMRPNSCFALGGARKPSGFFAVDVGGTGAEAIGRPNVSEVPNFNFKAWAFG